MTRSHMFFKLALRSAWVQPRRALIAMGALAVAAGVTTVVFALYSDAQSKLQQQFRSYGSNVMVSTQDGSALPPDALARVGQIIGKDGTVVPYVYAIARVDGAPVIVAGTDLATARKLNTWWSVTRWPSDENSVLVGKRVPLYSPDATLNLIFNGKAITVRVAGTLSTGGDEDRRIYLNLKTFKAWTGLQPSTLEIYVPGPAPQVNAAILRLAKEFPQLQVTPVRAITDAEASVLTKTRATFLAATILVTATALLCLLATLTAAALHRSRDFALMKALGASQLMATSLFALEAALLGAIGGIIGYIPGMLLARVIARVNFQAALVAQLQLLPEILLGSIVIALIAAAAPLSFLRRVQPAVILKGE